MGTRADYVTALQAKLATAGEDVAAVLDRPVMPVPGVPCVMVVPGAPYLEAAGLGGLVLVRLVAILWAGRLDAETTMDTFDRLLPLVRKAAGDADLRYLATSVQVEDSGGVSYVTARSELQGETHDP